AAAAGLHSDCRPRVLLSPFDRALRREELRHMSYGNGGLATIYGGSGFVGRHTVRALAKRGWRVRAAVRRPGLAGHLQPMGAGGQIQAIQANLRFPAAVLRAAEGADVVTSAVGVRASTGRQTLGSVHVEGARAVAKAAR